MTPSPFDAPDNCANCRGPRLCSYHEGWMDALAKARVQELQDVVEAVEFRRTQHEPCDRCYEDGCGSFCPCDYGCHNGVEDADIAVSVAISRLRGSDL